MRDVHISLDVSGDQRANVVTTCVDEADDQRFAAESLQGKRLALDIPECVVTDRLTDGDLADCESGLTVVVLLRRRRRPYPGEDKGAGNCSKTGGFALCA